MKFYTKSMVALSVLLLGAPSFLSLQQAFADSNNVVVQNLKETLVFENPQAKVTVTVDQKFADQIEKVEIHRLNKNSDILKQLVEIPDFLEKKDFELVLVKLFDKNNKELKEIASEMKVEINEIRGDVAEVYNLTEEDDKKKSLLFDVKEDKLMFTTPNTYEIAIVYEPSQKSSELVETTLAESLTSVLELNKSDNDFDKELGFAELPEIDKDEDKDNITDIVVPERPTTPEPEDTTTPEENEPTLPEQPSVPDRPTTPEPEVPSMPETPEEPKYNTPKGYFDNEFEAKAYGDRLLQEDGVVRYDVDAVEIEGKTYYKVTLSNNESTLSDQQVADIIKNSNDFFMSAEEAATYGNSNIDFDTKTSYKIFTPIVLEDGTEYYIVTFYQQETVVNPYENVTPEPQPEPEETTTTEETTTEETTTEETTTTEDVVTEEDTTETNTSEEITTVEDTTTVEETTELTTESDVTEAETTLSETIEPEQTSEPVQNVAIFNEPVVTYIEETIQSNPIPEEFQAQHEGFILNGYEFNGISEDGLLNYSKHFE